MVNVSTLITVLHLACFATIAHQTWGKHKNKQYFFTNRNGYRTYSYHISTLNSFCYNCTSKLRKTQKTNKQTMISSPEIECSLASAACLRIVSFALTTMCPGSIQNDRRGEPQCSHGRICRMPQRLLQTQGGWWSLAGRCRLLESAKVVVCPSQKIVSTEVPVLRKQCYFWPSFGFERRQGCSSSASPSLAFSSRRFSVQRCSFTFF